MSVQTMGLWQSAVVGFVSVPVLIGAVVGLMLIAYRLDIAPPDVAGFFVGALLGTGVTAAVGLYWLNRMFPSG